MKTTAYTIALTLILTACSGNNDVTTKQAESQVVNTTLENVIAHQRREDNQLRDHWRHPLETLSFFGIKADMTIVEVLPGNGGWYSQILTPLTAEQGRLIGVTYPDSLWSQMFSDWSEKRRERFGTDITRMGQYMSVPGVKSTTPIVGYTIDNIPDEENGKADAVLFFRALHHLFRFEKPLIDKALVEVYDVLDAGGVVGVVQPRAPESSSDEFASGNNGYLKQSSVIEAFKRAGFILEETNEINANPNDPADGRVWRLPPSSKDNPATLEIGESDRMTLRFRKPN